ncbi:MAG: hypothetical protein BGO69_09140 [Bacteroidetes bacterium 46-16]|nr:MAG: hypothetical protein BGO69_09140 [Bacteroidetes bacterium 46-16]
MTEKNLADHLRSLRRETNQLTHNPLLDAMEIANIEKLEAAVADDFIAQKVKNIWGFVKDHKVDFNPQLKAAFDEYSEGLVYLLLKEKFRDADRIPEGKKKTPDFVIPFDDDDNGTPIRYKVYVELKSLSFSDGNLNYKQVMNDAVDSQISIEAQVGKGAKVAFGEFEISPLHKSGQKEKTARKYEIETLIDKINQNIKPDQFTDENSILFIDLKQLHAGGDYRDFLPIFIEPQMDSLMSGLLWNVCFGKSGYPVFKQIEFEGKENLEGDLERDGILQAHSFIRAVCILGYNLGAVKPTITGLYRSRNVTDAVASFLHRFCDFVNDDVNSHGFMIDKKGRKID